MTTTSFIITVIVLTFVASPSWGQIETNNTSDCYKIQFSLKNQPNPHSAIIPLYQKHGFQLVENGVYDFIINGKKYFQCLLTQIDSLNFSITRNWFFENGTLITKDILIFSFADNITLRLLTINNGIGGLPFKVGKDYKIDFLKSNYHCKMNSANIDDKKSLMVYTILQRMDGRK